MQRRKKGITLVALLRVSASFLLGLAAIAPAALASSCGRASRETQPTNLEAGAGAFTTGGTESSAGEGGAGPNGTAGAPDFGVELDVSDCAARPRADCLGVDAVYDSNGGFASTPSLAQCTRFNSFDGCGLLEFAFDAEGCAVSVSPGPAGWKPSEHLASLRACLSTAFQSARFPCLASSTLRYEESCFIR